MTAPTFCRTQLHDQVTAHGVLLVSNDFPFVGADPGHDCNVATTSASVQVVTGKKLTSYQCREIANDPSGGTGGWFAVQVFKSQGMVAGVDFVRFVKRDVQVVRDLLKAGWYVTIFVTYAVINDNLDGKYAGSTYRGAHALSLAGWRVVKFNGVYRRAVWVYDPLFDGRDRPKLLPDAPFGRQRAPFWLYRHAAETYTGQVGIVSGYAVKARS